MMRHCSAHVLAFVVSSALLAGAGVTPQPAVAGPAVAATPTTTAYQFGKPSHFGRLTVAPLLGPTVTGIGAFTALDAALKARTAVVQEIGGDQPDRPEPNVDPRPLQRHLTPSPRPTAPTNANDPARQAAITPQQQMPEQQQVSLPGGGARVNTLEIVNNGSLPILVLAGTIVKGGRQDRQIGQDFVIAPKQKLPVDAFCVERGRWNASRDGKNTGGKFETAQILANQAVRAAGQYEQNQSKVWEKVSETNRAAGAETSSDTLSATLDNDAVTKARLDLARKVTAFLDGSTDKRRVVGLAYGIDGKPRAVRWFATPALFAQFRATLINTAAFDAVTTPPSAAGVDVRAEALTQPALLAFVTHIRQAKDVQKRTTTSGDVVTVWRSEHAYGSEMRRVTHGRETPVTADFLAK